MRPTAWCGRKSEHTGGAYFSVSLNFLGLDSSNQAIYDVACLALTQRSLAALVGILTEFESCDRDGPILLVALDFRLIDESTVQYLQRGLNSSAMFAAQSLAESLHYRIHATRLVRNTVHEVVRIRPPSPPNTKLRDALAEYPRPRMAIQVDL